MSNGDNEIRLEGDAESLVRAVLAARKEFEEYYKVLDKNIKITAKLGEEGTDLIAKISGLGEEFSRYVLTLKVTENTIDVISVATDNAANAQDRLAASIARLRKEQEEAGRQASKYARDQNQLIAQYGRGSTLIGADAGKEAAKAASEQNKIINQYTKEAERISAENVRIQKQQYAELTAYIERKNRERVQAHKQALRDEASGEREHNQVLRELAAEAAARRKAYERDIMQGEKDRLNQIKQNIKEEQIALKELEKSRLAALNTHREIGARQAIKDISTSVDFTRATPDQAGMFYKQLAALEQFVLKNKIAGADIEMIWSRIGKGMVQAYSGPLARLQAELLRLQKAQENFGKESQNNFKEMGLSWKSLERIFVSSIIYRVLYDIINLFTEGVKTAKEFYIKVAEVQTIAQDAHFSSLADQLRLVSDSWGVDLLTQTEAAYESLSNQVVNTTELFGFLESANKLAATTVATTDEAVNLLSSAINAYGLSAADAERLSAEFFKTVDLGRVRLTEMANVFGQIAVPAAQLGVTLEELQAMITTITISGINYHETATQIRGILTKLIKPTKDMRAYLDELGVATGKDAIATFRLNGLLGKLAEVTAKGNDEIAGMFNNIRGLIGILRLTGTGFDIYKSNLDQITESTKTYQVATERILGNTGKQFDIALTKIKNIFTQDIGVIETAVRLTDNFGLMTNAVEVFVSTVKFSMIPILAAVIGKMSILAVANPFVALVAAISVTLGVMTKLLNDTSPREVAKDHFNIWRLAYDKIEKAQKQSLSDMVEAIKGSVRTQNSVIGQFTSKTIADLNKAVKKTIEDQKDFKREFVDDIKDGSTDIKKDLKDIENSYDDLSDKAKDAYKDMVKAQYDAEGELFQMNIQGPEQDTYGSKLQELLLKYQKERDQISRGKKGGSVEDLANIEQEIYKVVEASQVAQYQIAAIEERIAVLRERRANTTDIDEYDRMSKEIMKLFDQRRDLIRKTGSGYNYQTEQILFQNEYVGLLNEEVSLKQELIDYTKELADAEKERALNLQVDLEKVSDALATVREFKLKDALAGDDAEQINENVQKYLDAIHELQKFETEYNKPGEFGDLQSKADIAEQARQQAIGAIDLQNKKQDRITFGEVAEETLKQMQEAKDKTDAMRTNFDTMLAKLQEMSTIGIDHSRLINELFFTPEGYEKISGRKIQTPDKTLGLDTNVAGEATTATTDQIKQLNDVLTEFSLLAKSGLVNEDYKQLVLAKLNVIKDSFVSIDSVPAGSSRENVILFQDNIESLIKTITDVNNVNDIYSNSDLMLERFEQAKKDAVAQQAETLSYFQDLVNQGKMTQEELNSYIATYKFDPNNLQNDVVLFNQAANGFSDAMKQFTQSIRDEADKVLMYRSALQGDTTYSAIQGQWHGGKIFKFASGGFVPGFNVGYDNVRAMLTPGEMVMNRGAVKDNYRTLLRMNQGTMRLDRNMTSTSNTYYNTINMPSTGSAVLDARGIVRSMNREQRRGTSRIVKTGVNV